jgi:hypothetical protein
VPGYLSTLLQIVANASVPVEIQHAAVLRFKNLVGQHWRFAPENDQYFSDQDKEVVKANIYETIVHQRNQLIRVQLCEAVYFIAQRDFPDKWSTLLPQVATGFQGQDLARTYASVSVLYQIFKRYRHKVDEMSDQVDALVSEIFPPLLQMFQHFAPHDSPEAIEMCRMVSKCFRVVNEYHLPQHLAKPKVIDAWVSVFLAYVAKPEPAELLNRDSDARINHPYWKCLKTICKLLVRLYQRYGQPEYSDEKYKKFATTFVKEQAPRLQNSFLALLEKQAAGAFLSARVLNSTFQIFNVAITQATLFKLLKKKLDFLIFTSIFSCLALKEEDLRLWHEDPQEFINRETDITTEFHDPRVAATNLLIDLVRTRTAQTLDRVLNVIGETLAAYSQAPTDAGLIVKKDVVMRAFGSLSELLVQKSEHKSTIEHVLVVHAIADLTHSNGFLRARASWVLCRFSNVEFTDKQHYVQMVQGVYNLLTDRELPVKMEACSAIAAIIRCASQLEPFRPLIPGIIGAFFQIIDEIGKEDVVDIFDSLIEKFGDEISPYAQQLVERMVQIFMSLVNADVDDDDAICTAMSCMRAVNTVLHSLSQLPHLYASLEPICALAINAVFSAQAMDFFDDILETITCFTYYPKKISDYMWSLFPVILQAFNDYAFDYISSMIHCIDNYICIGSERFVASKDLLEGTMSMCQKIFNTEGMEVETQYASKIVETLFAACIGRIDSYYSGLFRMLVGRLLKSNSNSLNFLLLNGVATAAHYNPQLFLAECVATNSTVALFNVWMSHCLELKTCVLYFSDSLAFVSPFTSYSCLLLSSNFQRRIAVLGLGSLCKIPIAQQPPELASEFHKVLLMMMQLLEQKEEQSESGDDDEDIDDEEFDDIDDEDFGDDDDEDGDPRHRFNEVDEDEDVVVEGDAEYLKMLSEKMKNGFGDFSSDIDDSDFESPLDNVNHYIFWAMAMQTFSQQNPQAIAAWTASLTAEQTAELQKWSAKASEEKVKEDAEAAKKAAGGQ